MAYRDLLLLLDDSEGVDRRVQAAVAFAKSIEGQINALHLDLQGPLSSALDDPLGNEIGRMQHGSEAEHQAASEKKLADACEAVAVPYRYRAVRETLSGIAESVVAVSRVSDIVIAGQPNHDAHGWVGPWLLETILLGGGKPVLAIPFIGAERPIGKSVLIAWDGGREAARAVADAMPMIRRAESVSVVSVNMHNDPQHPPASRLAEHLQRHDINATAETFDIDELSAGDFLLNRASDMGHDLIVMGAYAHSRLRQMVLGGVTRHMMQHMTVPVLMAH